MRFIITILMNLLDVDPSRDPRSNNLNSCEEVSMSIIIQLKCNNNLEFILIKLIKNNYPLICYRN